MSNEFGFIQIHDRYGRKYWVKQEDLDNTKRIQVPLYRRDGVRLLEPYTKAWQGRYQTIHRGNICPHPLRGFKRAILLGDPVKYCPQCEPNFPTSGGQ